VNTSSRQDPEPTKGIPASTRMLRDARVGRLATVDATNRPSVVPLCFAVLGEDEPVIASVLDDKPKRVADRELARVRNIRGNPRVALVVDHYDEDWSRLWFVQVRGEARLLAPGEDRHHEAIVALRAKYAQYRSMAIEQRPVILIENLRVNAWAASGDME